MKERWRIISLILIMTVITVSVVGITTFLLFRAEFDEQRARMVETAQSQARLIEAIARHAAIIEPDAPGGPEAATLSQIIDAREQFEGFGETGEFTLGRREGDQIVFLLRHRQYELTQPQPIAFDSALAEPMRLALQGQSGSLVGLDYRGEIVLAAYEPVAELDLGIVVKIDQAEIRAPFIRAGGAALGSALVLIIIGTILFLRISNPILKRLREHTEELALTVEERTAELDDSNEQLRALSQRLVEAHEEERRTIAKELHDQIGQSLTILSILVDQSMKSRKEDLQTVLGQLKASLVEAAQDMRDMSLRLRPGILDDLGLLPALIWHVQNYTEKTGIQVDLQHAGLDRDLPIDIRTAAYRIIQESLTNIARYAEVNEAKVTIRIDDNTLFIEVEDKGKGFDRVALSVNASAGLSGMQERAYALGGTLEIESNPGAGTRVTATILFPDIIY